MKGVLTVLMAIAYMIYQDYATSERYHELWTSQLRTMQTELDYLRNKVIEGEMQVASVKSKLVDLATTLSNENSASKDLKSQIEKNIFEIQRELTTAISKFQELAGETTNLVSERTKKLFDEFEQNKIDQQTRHQQLSLQLNEHIDSKVNKVQSALHSVEGKLSQNFKTINELGSRRCQSGEFGADGMGVFPKTFTVKFSPAFQKTPQFVYGLCKLDSTANVRYMANLEEITKDYAKVTISTWYKTKLYAGRMKWMACP